MHSICARATYYKSKYLPQSYHTDKALHGFSVRRAVDKFLNQAYMYAYNIEGAPRHHVTLLKFKIISRERNNVAVNLKQILFLP